VALAAVVGEGGGVPVMAATTRCRCRGGAAAEARWSGVARRARTLGQRKRDQDENLVSCYHESIYGSEIID
jgi:hypothetical protein